MKKTKSRPEIKTAAVPAKREIAWWPWLTGLAGLLVVFVAYSPALNGPFVLDDLHMPFLDPNMNQTFAGWIGTLRPLLMFTFWVDYKIGGGIEPNQFHIGNVFIHFFASVLVALIVARLLDWAGVVGRARAMLAVFAGALFLLHPLQTESVSYVVSRSENLSALFYFAAFAIFLYRDAEGMSLVRAIAILVLFGAAVATKEHTLTLPALFLLADFFWDRGIRKNAILYGMLAAGALAGVFVVLRVLRLADTAGFNMKGLTPATYFFTQCRVIWTYLRMFILPFGQNLDPDVPISQTLIDHGAIAGLIGLIALVAAAWIWRKKFPLASFGVLTFLLLLVPTSSVVPIKDVLAEHRMYLPFLGLVLIAVEFLRRLQGSQLIGVAAAVLVICTVLTYQRNQVWASPLALWQDAVDKSPNKYRPRFQLAYALQYEGNRCQDSADQYEKASHLGPVDDQLLVDWALALNCVGRVDDAVGRLREALQFGATAHVYSQIGMVYASHNRMQEALAALAEAEKINPSYDMTYVYRGGIYEKGGDRAAAAQQYRRALEIKPDNTVARDALARVGR